MRRCQVCGCSDEERCILSVRQAAAGRPAKTPAKRYDQTVEDVGCRLHRGLPLAGRSSSWPGADVKPPVIRPTRIPAPLGRARARQRGRAGEGYPVIPLSHGGFSALTVIRVIRNPGQGAAGRTRAAMPARSRTRQRLEESSPACGRISPAGRQPTKEALMGEGSAGPAAAAAAAASRPADASIAPKAGPVEYVVLDLTNEQEIRRVAGVFTGKTREEAVAKAIESSATLKADAAEKELALLPIARRLYDAAVKVKAETVPAKTELRFRS